MSTSSGSTEVLDALPLSADPAWHDVAPLEYEDGGRVVAIQYTESHREALAYFRAVMAKGERSARALALTEAMIGFNQADYTAWQWRWECLCALGQGVGGEYGFTDRIMQDNAKNYQLWNHRRKCALALGPGAAARELGVAAQALEEDEKNYHAWAHRQAIVKAFGGGLWAGELAFAEAAIGRDVRNNSAWNQRAFVVRHMLESGHVLEAGQGVAQGVAQGQAQGQQGQGQAQGQGQQEGQGQQGGQQGQGQAQAQQEGVPAPGLAGLLAAELRYVAGHIAAAPRNESAWNYLHGLFRLPGAGPHEMGRHEQVHAICTEALHKCPSCPPALDALAAFYMHLAHLAAAQLAACGEGPGGAAAAPATQPGPGSSSSSGALGNGDGAAAAEPAPPPGSVGEGPGAAARQALVAAGRSARALLEQLLVADPMRSMYWSHRAREVEALLEAMGVEAGALSQQAAD